MSIFKGLKFHLDLDGLGAGGLLSHLQSMIEAGEGELVQDLQSATHAVLRHKQQAAYQQAVQQLAGHVQIATVQWVLLSALKQQLLPPSEDDLHPAAAIPDFAEEVRQVTLSGIQGTDRAMMRYKVECTGAKFSPSMPLPATSHVITTAAVCEQPSEKIRTAAERKLHILSTDWVDACLAAWKHVPEGPYQLAVARVQPPQQSPQQQQSQQVAAPQPPPSGAAAGATTVGEQRQQQQQPLLSPVATGSGPSGLNIPPSDQSALLQLTQQKQQKPTQQQEVSQPRQQPDVPGQQPPVAAGVDRQIPVTGTVPVEFDGLEPPPEGDLAVEGHQTHRVCGRGDQKAHRSGMPGISGGTVAPAAAAAVGSAADEDRNAGAVDNDTAEAAADDGDDSSDETVASEEGDDADVGDEAQSAQSPGGGIAGAAIQQPAASPTFSAPAQAITVAVHPSSKGQSAAGAAGGTVALDTVVLDAGPAVTGETPALGGTAVAPGSIHGPTAHQDAATTIVAGQDHTTHADAHQHPHDDGGFVATQDFEELTLTQQKRQQQQHQEDEEEFLTAPDRSPNVFMTPAESLGAGGAGGSMTVGKSPSVPPAAAAFQQAANQPPADGPGGLKHAASASPFAAATIQNKKGTPTPTPPPAATTAAKSAAPAGEEHAGAAAAAAAEGVAARGVRFAAGSGSAGVGNGSNGGGSLDIKPSQFFGDIPEAVAGANKTVGNLIAGLDMSPEDSLENTSMLPSLRQHQQQQLSPVAAAPAGAAGAAGSGAARSGGGSGTSGTAAAGTGRLRAAGYRVSGLKRPSAAAAAGSGGGRDSGTARGAKALSPGGAAAAAGAVEPAAKLAAGMRGRGRGRTKKSVSPVPAVEDHHHEQQQQQEDAGRARRSGTPSPELPAVAAAAAAAKPVVAAGKTPKIVAARRQRQKQQQDAEVETDAAGTAAATAADAQEASEQQQDDEQLGEEIQQAPPAAAAKGTKALIAAAARGRKRGRLAAAEGGDAAAMTPGEVTHEDVAATGKKRSKAAAAAIAKQAPAESESEIPPAAAEDQGPPAAAATGARRRGRPSKASYVESTELQVTTAAAAEQQDTEGGEGSQASPMAAAAGVGGGRKRGRPLKAAAAKALQDQQEPAAAQDTAAAAETPAVTGGGISSKRRRPAAAEEIEAEAAPAKRSKVGTAAGRGQGGKGRAVKASPSVSEASEWQETAADDEAEQQHLLESVHIAAHPTAAAAASSRGRGKKSKAAAGVAASEQQRQQEPRAEPAQTPAAPAAAAARAGRGRRSKANAGSAAVGLISEQATAAAAEPAGTGPPATALRSGRATASKTAAADDVVEQAGMAEATPAEPVRSSRRSKQQQPAEQQPGVSTCRSRGSKQPELTGLRVTEQKQVVTSDTARRGRSAAASVAVQEDAEAPRQSQQQQQQNKRGRSTRGATAAAAQAELEESPSAAAAGPSRASASKAKGKTASKAASTQVPKRGRGKTKKPQQQLDSESEPESDATAVDSFTPGAAGGGSEPVVALSGMHSDDRAHYAAVLKKLKVKCLPQSHDWQDGTTHVVLESLKRSEKTLAAMAAGAWLVSEKWLKDSAIAGRLLEAEPYELDTAENGAITDGAPMHWRLRRQAGLTAEDAGTAPALAFQGLRVLFYGKSSSPSFDTLLKVLKAGGGEVLRRAAPYTGCLPTSAGSAAAASSKKKGQMGNKGSAAAAAAGSEGTAANLAIIGADKEDASDKWVASFQAAGVLCVRPSYLVEWLAHPWHDLDSHRLVEGEPNEELAALEEGRKISGAQQQMSMSF